MKPFELDVNLYLIIFRGLVSTVVAALRYVLQVPSHPTVCSTGSIRKSAAPADNETQLRNAENYLGGHVFVADTLEELAEKMGVPVDAFVSSVARYNELCEKGHDDDFYKLPNYLKPIRQAPFFAIRSHMATDGVFGGLDADENVSVLSHGKPVEGLYCAGDTIGNRYINQGGEKIECINDFSWAFASGYLAGKKILCYLG